MEKKRFNELLRLHNTDLAARKELYKYCLGVIKDRMGYRGIRADLESFTHSCLKSFVEHLPQSYVRAPRKYLERSVDNFLSNYKKKESRSEPTEEVAGSYEQRFIDLEKTDVFNLLVTVLGIMNGRIFYMYSIDEAPEQEIAKIFNLSYDALRQRICRSKEKLRSYLRTNVTIYSFDLS